jgi:SpoVK/Ycf46/Vps4 family AAA+-type ATPase
MGEVGGKFVGREVHHAARKAGISALARAVWDNSFRRQLLREGLGAFEKITDGGSRMPIDLPIILILYGPPGTGKTH